MNFDPSVDYCGRQSSPMWLRKCIPDKVFGVCLKKICYNHDKGWDSGSKLQADKRLRLEIKALFVEKKPGLKGRAQGWFVSLWYFLGVRLGSIFYDSTD